MGPGAGRKMEQVRVHTSHNDSAHTELQLVSTRSPDVTLGMSLGSLTKLSLVDQLRLSCLVLHIIVFVSIQSARRVSAAYEFGCHSGSVILCDCYSVCFVNLCPHSGLTYMIYS